MKKNHILGAMYIVVALILLAIMVGNIFKSQSKAERENAYFAKDVSKVRIDLVSLSQEITASSDNMLHVDFEDGAEEFCSFSKLNGKIIVKEKKNKALSFNQPHGTVLLAIPNDFSSTLNIESVSGSVKITDLKSDKIDLESVSGSISISNCEIGSLKCESVSGSQKIFGKFARADLSTVSGSIDFASETPLTKNSEFSSVSGSISLEFPKDADYALSFESISGSFIDNITGVSGKKNGLSQNGNGSTKLEVSTVSGSIKIFTNAIGNSERRL